MYTAKGYKTDDKKKTTINGFDFAWNEQEQLHYPKQLKKFKQQKKNDNTYNASVGAT